MHYLNLSLSLRPSRRVGARRLAGAGVRRDGAVGLAARHRLHPHHLPQVVRFAAAPLSEAFSTTCIQLLRSHLMLLEWRVE
jgi:hypothetical protein